MLVTFVYDRKNENHWSLLIIRYSLLITHYSEYKHPISTGEIFIISKYMLIILNLDLACIVNEIVKFSYCGTRGG